MEKAEGSYHHGDLRQALIDASLQLITDKGVAGLSLRGAARKAGVSSAAPYHHFPNRSALLAAIAGEGFQKLGEVMRSAAPLDSEDPDRHMRACGTAYVTFARRFPAHFRVMFRPELADPSAFPELKQCSQPVFEHLQQLVAKAQAEGAIPAGNPQRYVLLSWSAVQGLATLIVDGPLGAPFEGIDVEVDDLAQFMSESLAGLFQGAAAAQKAGLLPPQD